eukprot:CAMPEP_0174831492 /NCGR_PEP_ID=MMETSP1114-20130205/3126_1 /TAXON_ID=312471 /ORGANISM="Neobodo designis, Strain CCAP 1951/1" /LENGTH=224 /DNA_ID=CAMNT_0016065317 /DNA_START=62 /DNA_END=736 /DNA_ORIENTATION=+
MFAGIAPQRQGPSAPTSSSSASGAPGAAAGVPARRAPEEEAPRVQPPTANGTGPAVSSSPSVPSAAPAAPPSAPQRWSNPDLVPAGGAHGWPGGVSGGPAPTMGGGFASGGMMVGPGHPMFAGRPTAGGPSIGGGLLGPRHLPRFPGDVPGHPTAPVPPGWGGGGPQPAPLHPGEPDNDLEPMMGGAPPPGPHAQVQQQRSGQQPQAPGGNANGKSSFDYGFLR